MQNNVKWVIEDGLVKKEQTAVLEAVPLSEFFENVSKLSPTDISTPVLPPNTIKYICSSDRETHGLHTFVLYYPSAVRTIYYGSRGGSIANNTAYNIVFPSLAFKINFSSRMTITGVHVAVTEGRPTRDQAKLFKFRIPNLSGDRICMNPASSPGDMAESCINTIDGFFVGQSFNTDWSQFPHGVTGFPDWQAKTVENERFLEDHTWDYHCTLGEWVLPNRR